MDCSTSEEDTLKELSEAYRNYKEANNKEPSTLQYINLIDAYQNYMKSCDSQDAEDSNTEMESSHSSHIQKAVTFCQKKFETSNTNQLLHQTLCPKDSGGATSTAIRVSGLSIMDSGSEENIAKVTLIEKDGHRYTRIGPGPTCKRPRPNPGLRRIQLPTNQDSSSSRVIRRSASVPANSFNPILAAANHNQDNDDENKNPFQHRLLFRTGSSVQDSTKAKLRDDILSGKSAAVWRKPSITELRDQFGTPQHPRR